LKVTELNSEREPANRGDGYASFFNKTAAIPFFDVIYEGRAALRRADLNSKQCMKKLLEILFHNCLKLVEE
jgi:hypothetical protein